ncbi:MAG TPA: AlkA N-terminal domain-containing protein [Rhizomicrobium sp.]|jgi:AraC family transcriptional regulator of adaptative response / DNA-3-methyladenine glycosylase II
MKESELDWRICQRARLSRDPRFDGKFFIGVRGSGVYCRPICPAPTAKEKNCRYYASAAAAQEAGYRPCLRCRPESSPGTPAWAGTSTTVSRALRLIHEMGPDDGGMEALAARLGVGSRHLRRLFLRHLGATPHAVAQTRRMDFAKKLIDETSLPMTELAIAAGFGSVRRFNAQIRKTYHRTPTQIRAIARKKLLSAENEYEFRLRFRPPYGWNGMLAFLEERAVDCIEKVENGVYRRTIQVNESTGSFDVSLDEKKLSLIARIRFDDPRALFFIVERIRAMFDLNADWAAIEKGLAVDKRLARRLKGEPGLRVPGCWNGFELAVRALLGCAAGTAEAKALIGRLVRAFGQPLAFGNGLTHVFPESAALACADLAGAGLGPDSASAIRVLAQAAHDGTISFEAVSDSTKLLARLRAIAGMNAHTAHYVAMRALGEPDAFPFAIADARRAESWRPWRAYAAMYLWKEFPAPMPKKARESLRAAQRKSGVAPHPLSLST